MAKRHRHRRNTKKKSLPLAITAAGFLLAAVFLLSAGGGEEEQQSRVPHGTLQNVTAGRFEVAGGLASVPPNLPLDAGIGETVFGAPGFVLIHEDAGGMGGAIVGSAVFVSSGGGERLSVHMAREAKKGEVVYAVLYADNGDSIFRPADDLPVRRGNGSIVHLRFCVSCSALAAAGQP